MRARRVHRQIDQPGEEPVGDQSGEQREGVAGDEKQAENRSRRERRCDQRALDSEPASERAGRRHRDEIGAGEQRQRCAVGRRADAGAQEIAADAPDHAQSNAKSEEHRGDRAERTAREHVGEPAGDTDVARRRR